MLRSQDPGYAQAIDVRSYLDFPNNFIVRGSRRWPDPNWLIHEICTRVVGPPL